MGIVLIIISLPFYFFFTHIGIIISIVGLLTIIIKKQKDFSKKIKEQRAKIIYHEIRYNFPVSEETFTLSKIFDVTPNLNSHKNWLTDAINAFEKEYRISKNKMFLYNRNHSAAKFPYISISIENMNYKKGENYIKAFYKSGNYKLICKYLNRRTIAPLEEQLDTFTRLIEKQENKQKI